MSKFNYVYEDPTTFVEVSGSTPYGIYDTDEAFQSESLSICKFVSRRLGHPVMQLEMATGSIYAMFEEAVTEYSTHINNFNIKTSSVTVELSDAKHGGESLSDILQRQEYHLINADVTIYYKSPSCTDFSHSSIDVGPFGCPRVYEGKVNAVQESKDKITLSIEDGFSSNLELELPYWKVGTENDVPDKWKNKPYPMFYGELENAPTIGKLSSGSFTLYPDYYDINNIYQLALF